MAFNFSPKIVTGGLILYLDAANIKSYPGTGTTWNDLGRGAYSGTLVNGPTFSSANGGAIIFDGSNDLCQFVSNLNSLYAQPPLAIDNFTIDLWCLPTQTHEIDTESTTGIRGTGGQKYLSRAFYEDPPNAGAGVSIGTNGVSVYEHSGGYMPPLLVHQTTISQATNIVVVYTSKRPTLYINSQFARQGLLSPRTAVYLRASTVGGAEYGYFGGSCYTIRYYNRSLSVAEIAQNFNATRTRFGV